MDQQLEAELIERAKHDAEAFGRLFDLYHARILRYCLSRTGNAEAARDITAETFFKALKNLWKFRFMGASFSGWLYRIAGNEINNHYRKKSRSPSSLDAYLEKKCAEGAMDRAAIEAEIADAQAEMDRNYTAGIVRKALRQAPAIYQEVLVLRYVEDLSIQEICGVIGKKEGTVKSLLSRGIALLRQDKLLAGLSNNGDTAFILAGSAAGEVR
jgi:RNA polymerase sigma-70 factor (ECF subfamily)